MERIAWGTLIRTKARRMQTLQPHQEYELYYGNAPASAPQFDYSQTHHVTWETGAGNNAGAGVCFGWRGLASCPFDRYVVDAPACERVLTAYLDATPQENRRR